MRISYNWLKELLPELWISPQKVANLLTRHSFETAKADKISIDPKVTVAKITDISPHPNADKLRLVTIDTDVIKATVVCGADNININDIVPYSPEGTTLEDQEGKPFKLKKATIRGVESAGMLNSPKELGLGDWHGGIYLLPADTPEGDTLSDHIKEDTILEADITPNRAHDCLSHMGIAREIAALLDLKINKPDTAKLPSEKPSAWMLNIENNTDTPRYQGMIFSDITVSSSPLWLQAKLWAMGTKPINNIVDITNYVMYELGNPTHAFDASKLPAKEIGVRRAKSGEALTTLDEDSCELNENDLIITSQDQPIALAGVMGGLSSQVTPFTKEIFLETANFKPYLIQETGIRLKKDTESSMRFKKGITPDLTEHSAMRTAHLLTKLANATATGVIENYPQPVKPKTILYNPSKASDLAGTAIDIKEARKALQALRCQVEPTGNNWQVTIPVDRLDLSGPHDLSEEIIRTIGLEQIKAKDPTTSVTKTILPDKVQWRESVRALLVGYGFTETINYSFEDEKILQKLDIVPDTGTRVKLTNPPAPERAYLRQSLVPQLIKNIIANKAEISKKFTKTEKSLFEIGQVFFVGEEGKVTGIIERENIAGVIVGDSGYSIAQQLITQTAELFGITENESHLTSIKTLPADSPISKKIGQPITYFELSLETLITDAEIRPSFEPELLNKASQYQAPSKYPAIYRDLSILVDQKVSIEEVQEIIERVGGEMVLDVDLFDTYQPASSDSKGLAFHIAYQSRTKTLTDKEITALHNEIVATLKEDLDARLRE